MFRIPRSLPFVMPGLSIAICISAVAALVAIGGMMTGGPRTAHADADCAWVEAEEEELCISLDPETASNPVDTGHTATATVTWDGLTYGEDPVDIVVFDGPNVGEEASGETDGSGQFPLTYTGDGGPGTDSIIGLSCTPDLEQVCASVIQSLIDCPSPGLDPTCLAAAEATCDAQDACVFDVATKEWVEPTPTPTATATPTATPTATATPTPTQAAAPAEELPATGGQPPDGSSSALPWLAVIAGAIAVMGASGFWLAHQRRHIR